MSWDELFFGIADLLSKKSTCLRRQYGCVLVRNRVPVAMGYNGAPRGATHCADIGCAREGVPSGQQLEKCRAVHAEQNAVINAAREGVSTVGTECYIRDIPCPACARILINAGITAVHYCNQDYPGWEFSARLFGESGVRLVLHKMDDKK